MPDRSGKPGKDLSNIGRSSASDRTAGNQADRVGAMEHDGVQLG
jgi:hypothetical protein